MPGQEFKLEVNPRIPTKLDRLPELADDLWYSWHRPARALFRLLNPKLWSRTGHSPKLFLRSVDENTLREAAEDQVFLANYHQVVSAYDTYLAESSECQVGPEYADDDLVAYFCAEYGFHESVPLYSGGLGILAGDHCKTASDMRVPFLGVGLLYRQGYFTQNIDAEGNQVALYHDTNLDDLPVKPVVDEQGKELRVEVRMPGRDVQVRVWRCRVGNVRLFLLDTNVDENSAKDREITHKLYGGGSGTRIRQEIILGIGGVRALRKLALRPTVWHVNEGHAAFSLLERVRELVVSGVPFDTAMESVAAKTVFTTHTPVPAGHDVFPEGLVQKYFHEFAPDLGISIDDLVGLGHLPHQAAEFNMTTLALGLSRHQNGVSRIHGRVSSEICVASWPQVPPVENPISYVTNGVHVPSFLAQAWCDLFDRFIGAAWRNHLTDAAFWERIDEIPDHLYWSVSQSIKSQMFYALHRCLRHQHQRNQVSDAHLERLLRYIDPSDPNVLTIGFARRFATYKRATLLMNDLNWLRVILSDEERPVVFIFAGKAHPADMPGQALLKQIHNLSAMPEFVGKVLVVEGYGLALARRLVSGVDIWLNNPMYPKEASGTSGMKAAINGRINLSVLDGWWDEGYDGENGWAIKASPHEEDETRRDYEDARTLYEILQDDVVPLYHARGKHGYSPGWVRLSKRSMKTVLPRFNTCRMLNEYGRQLYLPAARQGRKLCKDSYALAGILADWKRKVRSAWPGVALTSGEVPAGRIALGETTTLEIWLQLNGLEPADVTVELLLCRPGAHEAHFVASGIVGGEGFLVREWESEEVDRLTVAERFRPSGDVRDDGQCRYVLELKPEWCGALTYRVRAFPYHPHLTHTHEMGLMLWL